MIGSFEVVSYCDGCPCHHKNGVVEVEIAAGESDAVAEAKRLFVGNGRYDDTRLVYRRPGRPEIVVMSRAD